MRTLNDLIYFGMILMIGSAIKRTIEEECPEVYKQYLGDRSQMKWYKRLWYMK